MVGGSLRRQRRALGLSQAEVAAAIHVAASSVGNWEAGRGAISLYDHTLLMHFFRGEIAKLQLAVDNVAEPAESGEEGVAA